MTHADALDLARYAAIFAADAGPDALYYNRNTDEMADLCLTVAKVAIVRRDAADEAGKNFYACAFVEQAAALLWKHYDATLEQILDAGQRESDSLAGKE